MRLRKFIAAMTVLLLLGNVLLVGCSTDDKKEADNTKATSEVKVTKEDAGDKSDEADQEPEEEIQELEVFINHSWYPVNSFEGIIPEEITKQTGVKLNVTVATDASQLGVMIGAGEIPDLIFTSSEFDRLSKSDLCISFDELESDFGGSFDDASDLAKGIARTYSDDGQYYTLLNMFNTNEEWADMKLGAPGQTVIYYRKDILEAMGSPKLENMDDFLNVLRQVKETYPEMVPYGLGGYWKMHPVEVLLGVTASQYSGDGNYYHPASAPKYREFLEYANVMAREGLMTIEAYANENEADSEQLVFNSKTVFYPWYLSYGNLSKLQTETSKNYPEAEWAVMPLIGEKGIGTSSGWSGTFVSRDCENPEAAAKILSYLYSEEGSRTSMWGREGIDYTLDSEGIPQFSEQYMEAKKNNQMNEVYNTWFYFGAKAIQEIYANYSGLDDELVEQFLPYGEGFKNYPEVSLSAPVSGSDEGVIVAKLDEIRRLFEAKAIFAETDETFESIYNEYMDALETTGVKAYNDYMTEAIKKTKVDFGF